MNRNAAHPVLRVSSLSRNFGGLRALNDVDLDIRAGEIVAAPTARARPPFSTV